MTTESLGEAARNGEDPGASRVGRIGIAVVSSYLAVLKLKEIAETLLTKPPPGRDSEPEKPKSVPKS
jgi:hypothetical protein